MGVCRTEEVCSTKEALTNLPATCHFIANTD